MRFLFVGGSGEISAACVADAKRAGHDVATFNRGRTREMEIIDVERIHGDVNDRGAYTALARRNFDVVCQFLAYQPHDVDRDAEIFSGRCGHYIFVSSASVYQKPCPALLVREDAPLGNPYWAYSRAKAACEDQVLAAHDGGKLSATIVRPSHTYRTRLPSTVVSGDHLAWRILHGKPVIVHGDGESVWTLTHAEDFARAFTRLGGNREAFGECVHITDSRAYTWTRIINTVAEAMGHSAQICNVLSRSLVEYNPEWTGPLLGDKSNSMMFDNQKITRLAAGWRCDVTLEDGIGRAWRHAETRLSDGFEPSKALDDLVDKIIHAQTS